MSRVSRMSRMRVGMRVRMRMMLLLVDLCLQIPFRTRYLLFFTWFMPLTETRRDCAAEEEESEVEGNEDINESPSSHCNCTTYV